MPKPIRIENWAIVTDPDPYVAPELRKHRLCGNVYNYPGREDGQEVTTSSIRDVDKNRGVVICGSREYLLGEPNSDYEKEFPNAKERILSQYREEATIVKEPLGYYQDCVCGKKIYIMEGANFYCPYCDAYGEKEIK